MAGEEEGSRSAGLMARMLKELQQINEAQHLQDSVRADLQRRREQARQSLITNQNRLDQIKGELSGLYQQESRRRVLCDVSNPVNVDTDKRLTLTQENISAKQKLRGLRNEQVQMCLDKLSEHDKAIVVIQSSSARHESVIQETKVLAAELVNLERKIAGVTASTKAASSSITKLQKELSDIQKGVAASKTLLSDHKGTLGVWLQQEPDAVSAIVKGNLLTDSSDKAFLKAGTRWLQNQEIIKTKELQLLTEMIKQRQNELKLLT